MTDGREKTLKEPLPLRTKIALYLLLIAIRMVDGWEYEHQYEEEIKDIKDLIKKT